MFAEILIEYPSKKIDKTFTYIVPKNLENIVKVGMQVRIPFNNKIINGFVFNVINGYEVGEGIEKREENFAEEVMNQVKGN